MRVEKDFEEFLKLLNKHKVRYLIIGSFAVAFYARARYTKDLDIFIAPSIENGKKIIKALIEFGFKTLHLTEKDFTKRGNIIQLGYEPVRIDIMNSLEGVIFSDGWERKRIGEYGKERVFFIGLKDLIQIKKRSKRKIDKVDLDLLLKAHRKRNLR
ncbi:hypothetical protein ES703_18349 [subsurface metagenome]